MTSLKANETLERVGPNELKKAKGTNWSLRFIIDVFGDFNILLWIGGVLCFFAYGAQYSQTDSPPGDNVSMCKYSYCYYAVHTIIIFKTPVLKVNENFAVNYLSDLSLYHWYNFCLNNSLVIAD